MLFFSFLFCCLFCFVVCWLIIFSCREFAWFFWKKILPKFLNKEKEKNVSLHGNKRRTQFDQDQDQDLRKCLFCAWVRGRWQVGGGGSIQIILIQMVTLFFGFGHHSPILGILSSIRGLQDLQKWVFCDFHRQKKTGRRTLQLYDWIQWKPKNIKKS